MPMGVKDKKALFKLGQKIEKLYREQHGSLNQFSIISGVENRTLRRIIRGEVNPRLITLMKIANGLNMHVSVLLEDI